MRMILLNMVLGSVSFGCVRCLRYMLARRVCRRQAPPEASGRNLWKGTQTCFGGGVHTSKRRVGGSREGERASEWAELHGARHAERQTERQTGREPTCSMDLSWHEIAESRSEQRCCPQNP